MRSCNGFEIVLCRAEGPGNVGAVCRAMKTMGFHGLTLADCPEYPDGQVKTYALHAYDIYESARRCPDLETALRDCSLAAGFTRRGGRLRARRMLDVEDFARRELRRQGSTALVFGNERDGLSKEELASCDLAVRIPTSDSFPSLNLAQAVQIACWELSRNLRGAGKESPDGERRGEGLPASRARLDEAAAGIADDLARIGFFKIGGRPDLERFFRSLLARAGADAGEIGYLGEIFRKAAALSGRANPDTLTRAASEARVFEKNSTIDVPEGDRPCDE